MEKITYNGVEYYRVKGYCNNCSLGKIVGNFVNFGEYRALQTCFFKYNCGENYCYKEKSKIRKEKIKKLLK